MPNTSAGSARAVERLSRTNSVRFVRCVIELSSGLPNHGAVLVDGERRRGRRVFRIQRICSLGDLQTVGYAVAVAIGLLGSVSN